MSLTSTALPGTSPALAAASEDGLYAAGLAGNVASGSSVATGTWTTLASLTPITALGNVRDISARGRLVVGQGSSTSSNSFTGYATDFGVSPPVTMYLLGNTNTSRTCTDTSRTCAGSDDGAVIVGGGRHRHWHGRHLSDHRRWQHQRHELCAPRGGDFTLIPEQLRYA